MANAIMISYNTSQLDDNHEKNQKIVVEERKILRRIIVILDDIVEYNRVKKTTRFSKVL
jgi:hypothetical protein